ncbi:MAG: DUF721 domain-containing protein [Patescibacteria group bacterium]
MPIALRDLLPESLRKAGIAKEVNAARVCSEFNVILKEVLGGKAAEKANAIYVKNGTLTIAVMSSVIGQEIKLHEHELLQKLGEKVGQKAVERLRFLV